MVHRKVGPPGGVGARVEEAGDARVLEGRQDAALGLEAARDAGHVEANADAFQGDLALEEAVGAFHEEDLAHAATPEQPQRTVGPAAVRQRLLAIRLVAGNAVVKRGHHDGDGWSLQKVVRLLGVCQQVLNFGAERVVVLTQVIEERWPVGGLGIERCAEDGLEALPAVGVGGHGRC